MSHILSAGGVGGWVVTYNALLQAQVPHGLIFVAIAAQQFFNYVVLWFFFALALVYLIVVRGGESIVGYLVGIVLIVLILWLTVLRRLPVQPPHPDAPPRRPGGAPRQPRHAARGRQGAPHRRLARQPASPACGA